METRRGRRQLQFTGVEMTALAVSFLVTSTCVFFLGFYVGKKNAAAHATRDERIARIPVDDFSKYSRPALEAGAQTAAPGKDAEPQGATSANKAGKHAKGDGRAVAAAAGASAAPTTGSAGERGGDNGGQPHDAAAASSPAADARQQQAAPADDDAAMVGPDRPDARSRRAQTGDLADAKPAAAKPGEAKPTDAKPADAKTAEAKAADAKAAEAAKNDEDNRKTGAGGYTVQVLATRKQGDAEALVKKLASRGYGAYIKRVSDGQTSWYRVRVGRYGVFGEARTMADHCRRELGLEQAFVSTE